MGESKSKSDVAFEQWYDDYVPDSLYGLVKAAWEAGVRWDQDQHVMDGKIRYEFNGKSQPPKYYGDISEIEPMPYETDD